MVSYRPLKVLRKGNAWWTDEIEKPMEEKRRAYKKILQRNVAEEIRVRRTEYKYWKRKIKEEDIN